MLAANACAAGVTAAGSTHDLTAPAPVAEGTDGADLDLSAAGAQATGSPTAPAGQVGNSSLLGGQRRRWR